MSKPSQPVPIWALHPPTMFPAQREHASIVQAQGLEGVVNKIQEELEAIVASFAMGGAGEP